MSRGDTWRRERSAAGGRRGHRRPWAVSKGNIGGIEREYRWGRRIVSIRATPGTEKDDYSFDVTVVGAGGEVVAEYIREWGDAPTDSADPTLQLRLLCVRPGGWRDSVVRRSLPGDLVAFLDSEAPADLGADLRALRDVSARRGWAATVEGALRSLGATGGVDAATLELAAARAAAGDALVEYDEPVDLAGYDRAFELLEGGAASA